MSPAHLVNPGDRCILDAVIRLSKEAQQITDWESWSNSNGLPDCMVCGATRYASGYKSCATSKWLCEKCFSRIEGERERKCKRESLVCDGHFMNEGKTYFLKVGETYLPRDPTQDFPAVITGFQPFPDGNSCMVVFDRGWQGFKNFLKDHIVSPSIEKDEEDNDERSD